MTQQFGTGLHPDLPPYLVHFTGRPRRPGDLLPSGVPADPEGRLAAILGSGFIRGYNAFGTAGPVVCVSEPSLAGLQKLFSTGVTARGPYAPWALVLERQQAVAAGFRPVWHMDDQDRAATEHLPAKMRDRRVSYTPGRVEWLAEREWRYCWGDDAIMPGHVPGIGLSGLLLAVIVGRQGWSPAPGPYAPHLGLQRWLWNGQCLVSDGVFTR